MVNEDQDAKVAQIRAAGKKLFLQRGYDRTSTAALAREAGVSKETLYSRFPNKEAILIDVLEHLIPIDELDVPAAPTLRTRSDLHQALADFAVATEQLLMQRDYLELVRIIMAETPRLPRLGEVFRDAVPQRLLQTVETLLAGAADAGLIADVDRPAAARLVMGPILIEVIMNGLLIAPSKATASRRAAAGSHIALVANALTPTGKRSAAT